MFCSLKKCRHDTKYITLYCGIPAYWMTAAHVLFVVGGSARLPQAAGLYLFERHQCVRRSALWGRPQGRREADQPSRGRCAPDAWGRQVRVFYCVRALMQNTIVTSYRKWSWPRNEHFGQPQTNGCVVYTLVLYLSLIHI